MTDNGFIVGMAGPTVSLHSLMCLARAGLASPTDIESAIDGVTQLMERLPDNVSGKWLSNIDPLLAEVKQAAIKNWKGA